MYVCENNSFKIHLIILMHITNANIPFEFAELLPKHIFVYFRDRSENGEGNKLRRRRKYMRKSN